MTTRGPQPPGRLGLTGALVAAVLLAGLVAPGLAGPAPAAAATSSPTAGLPIHGAGSDEGAVATPAGVVERIALAALTGPASCTGWASETQAPGQIRVYRTKTFTVETLDFRAYARKVVTGEFARAWPFQLLAIGAIVAKQNAWYWTMRGRDWSNLANWGGRANPIQRITLPDGRYQWQTTAGSPSGPGQCWDVTDNPGIDQCYDCGSTPVDPASAPRNQEALDATWGITLRRPRSGVQSFFAPGYAGRAAATCPSMATVADWETWFTGNIDFNQAYVCATAQGESAEMLLRRFLSSVLQVRDPSRSDITGDGVGDIPILRVGRDAGGATTLALDPATSDGAYLPGASFPPLLAPDPGVALARGVGRLDRPDRASLVSLSLDGAGTATVTSSAFDGPGAASTTTWWNGPNPGFDPRSTFGLTVADITGDMRPDVLVLERAQAGDPSAPTWSLRLWVLVTTDSGADPGGFVRRVELGPFAVATRFERVGDVDGDGRVDLVYAPGDSPGFLVARTARDASGTIGASEPYGTLTVPAIPAEWRFFALADGSGTGRDEPIVAASGSAAAAAGAGSVPLALLTGAAASDPTTYAFTVAPLAPTWSGTDPGLVNGLEWAGDVGGDGLADFAILTAAAGTVPLAAGGTGTPAALAVVGVRDGAPPTRLPVVSAAALEDLRVVAPGDQSVLPPDSTLSALGVNLGTLRPAFRGDATAYTVVVSTSVTSIRIKPTTTRTWARLSVNGVKARSAFWTPAIPLRIGANPIVVGVTDGPSSTTYTVTVVRASVPGAPVITKLAAVGAGRVRINWKAGSTGGSPITSWMVQYRRLGTTAWSIVRIPTATPLAWTLRGLRAGWTYEVRVVARNIVGLGTASVRLAVRLT